MHEKMMRESPLYRKIIQGGDYKSQTRQFLERIKSKHTASELNDWAQALMEAHKGEPQPYHVPNK